MTTFNFVSAAVKTGSSSSFSCFQQFVMALTKLWLNLGDQDLSYQFGVSQSTISRNMKKWIDILFVRLSPLIKWPDREELLRTLPMDFRKTFGMLISV